MKYLKKYILALSVAMTAMTATAQDLRTDWEVNMYGTGSTAGATPFWAVSGKNGLFPTTDGGLMTAGAALEYGLPSDFSINTGVSLALSAVPGSWSPMVDRLYVGAAWKKFHLDLGMKNRPVDFEGLSVSGGNIIWSSNARNIPGADIHTDYINLGKVFSFRGSFGNYLMIDNRYVDNTRLMERSLDLKFALSRNVDFTVGLEVWSQWGGTSPTQGRQPDSFKDFIRVALGMSGGSDATISDQINVLGNHLGHEIIRVDWKTDRFKMVFQHDIPFDDGSGMGFQNFPDGINTILFSSARKDRWVSDVLYEYVYTKWQSGTRHDRPAHEGEKPDLPNGNVVVGGCDNYFNNGTYRSGWTYYGRTIGIPLFTPAAPDADGIVNGIVNNRITAHHFGMKGMMFRKLPYRMLVTYSRNYGCYHQRDTRFNDTLEQFSVALEGTLPALSRRFPVEIGIGAYADFGEILADSCGLTFRLTYKGGSFKKLSTRSTRSR